MVNVKVQARGATSTSSVSEAAGGVAVSKPSDISLDLTSSDVSNYARLGDNLVITLADGSSVIIEDFFVISADGEVSRLFLGGEGELAFVDLSGVGGEAFVGGSTQASASLAFDVADAAVASDAAGAIASSLASNAGGITAVAGGAAIAVAAGSGGGAAAVAAVVASTVSGSIVAGPTVAGHGLTAEVFDAAGNSLGEAVVNSDGSFTVSITSDYSGAILVRVKDVDGGTVDYFDEGRGATVDLTSDLRAASVVNGAGDYVVNVNVLTELAVRNLGLTGGDAGASSVDLSGTSAADVTAANTAIGTAHGLTGDITAQDVNATIDATGTANPSANLYGEILASYSGLEVSKDMTLTEVLEAYTGTTLSDAAKLDLVSGAIAASGAGDGTTVAAALGVTNADDVVTGLAAVAVAANGSVDGSTGLSTTEAEALGLGTLSPAELALLNEVIDGSASTAVDSVAELQALAAAAVGVAAGAAGTAGEPTLEDLTALGIEGVTDANLPAIQAAIAATADDGSDVSTVAALQGVVTAMVDVLATAAGEPAELSVEDLGLLGVTVTPEQLSAVTAAIAATNVDGTEVDTPEELLDVAATALALAEISTYEGAAPAPTEATYATAGVTGVDNTNIDAVNALLADPSLNAAATNTAAEVQDLVNGLTGVLAGAAGTADKPTTDDLEDLGFTNVTVDNLPAIQAAIAAAGTAGVGTLAEIQALVNDTVEAIATLSSHEAGDPDLAASVFEDAGVTGLDAVITGVADGVVLAAVNDAVAVATDLNSNSLEELQAITDGMIAVLDAAANGTANEPSSDDLTALGIEGVTDANLPGIQAAIAATVDDGSAVSTIAGLQDVVTAMVGAMPKSW